MTKEEAMKIPDLQIEVTELVEDAFYAFREIDESEWQKRKGELSEEEIENDDKCDELERKFFRDCDNAERAHERWKQCSDPMLQIDAMLAAHKMIENQKKYGVPCAAWCK